MTKYKIKSSKLVILLIAIFILISIPCSYAIAQGEFPAPTNLKYVNDYSGILSEDTKEYIVSVGYELERKTGAQAVVVIIDSLDGNDIESYGNELFRNWGIGQKDKNNGLLILLALKDRSWNVEVGRGLEGAIPDILSNRVMQDVAIPEFKNENYDKGLRDSFSIFADLIADEYGVTLDKSEKLNYNYSENSRREMPISGLIILALIFIDIVFNRGRVCKTLLRFAFYSSFFGGRGGGRRGGRGGGFGSGGFGGGNFGGFGGGDSGGGGSSGKW